jgi:GMP synthase (glutamine-hydrolysing)
MKLLVLQMRGAGDDSRLAEREEYLRYTGLPAAQIDFIDLFEQPVVPAEQLLNYDCLMVGGISRDLATELTWPESRFPFIHHLYAIFRLAIAKKVPSLLSCGGFVIAGSMLGGKMQYKLRDFELGVYKMLKTETARQDLFLGPTSEELPMVSGHVKYFAEAPPNTELLLCANSYAPGVPIHAFKVKDAPFYAFQGHPEISCNEIAQRIEPLLYRKHYFPKRDQHPEDEEVGYNVDAYRAFCALKMDTAEAQGLLRRFVHLVQQGAFTKGST